MHAFVDGKKEVMRSKKRVRRSRSRPKVRQRSRVRRRSRNRTKARGVVSLGKDGPIQMGFWIPHAKWATDNYIVPLWYYMNKQHKAGLLKPMTPVIAEFKDWVVSNSTYRMWVVSMITASNDYVQSISTKTRKAIRSTGDTVGMGDFDMFFEVLNEIIQTSPGFNETEMVGVPMSAYLTVSMGTQAGIALYNDTEFNKQIKKVLDGWNSFLKSPESLDKLDIKNPEKPGSWISKAAFKAGVWKDIQYDPKKPAFGFKNWNAFFLRKFVPGARPFLGHEKEVINIGCETTPWQYANNLAFESRFWIKEVEYSLLDLFGGQEKWADLFVGGQAYQGFLSATHFHRWTAPITGTVVRSWRQQGSYFAQRPAQLETRGSFSGMIQQPFLMHVATRAIFILKHPSFGYIGLIMCSMGEVGSCVIDKGLRVDEGARPVRIARGESMGRFEFGGSTHLMVFQKGKADLVPWARNAQKHRNDPVPQKMGSIIARRPK